MAKVHTLYPGGQLQLRIELKSILPKIWREVVVPETITLTKLHQVIQVAMGWTDTHLHEFDIARQSYGVPDPDWDFDDRIISERGKRLLKVLAGRKSFNYLYDFGDGWEHRVTVKQLRPTRPNARYAICIGGENACPPEDVGGPYGYVDYLEAISNKTHPEHQQMIEWRGEGFDPTAFDINITNEILKSIRL